MACGGGDRTIGGGVGFCEAKIHLTLGVCANLVVVNGEAAQVTKRVGSGQNGLRFDGSARCACANFVGDYAAQVCINRNLIDEGVVAV